MAATAQEVADQYTRRVANIVHAIIAGEVTQKEAVASLLEAGYELVRW